MRSVSRHVSRRKIWSPSTRPTSSRKLLLPMSTTASMRGAWATCRWGMAWRREGVAGSPRRKCYSLKPRARRCHDQRLSQKILTAHVYDVARRRRSILRPISRRASATACCSSARTCSRCSRSSCAAPTTRWRGLPRERTQARRDRLVGGQPRAGRGARGAEARLPRDDRHAGHDAAHQGRRGARARRRRASCTATPTTRPMPRRSAGSKARGCHVRASLRRSRRDRRPGHHRHGDPAPEQRSRSTRSSSRSAAAD